MSLTHNSIRIMALNAGALCCYRVLIETSGVRANEEATTCGQSWNPVLDTQHAFGAIITVSGDPRIYGRVYIGTEGRGIVYGDLLN